VYRKWHPRAPLGDAEEIDTPEDDGDASVTDANKMNVAGVKNDGTATESERTSPSTEAQPVEVGFSTTRKGNKVYLPEE